MKRLRRRAILTIGLALFGGCAKYPTDQGISDVQREVQQRSDLKVQWNQGSQADAQVAKAVHNLLQKELTIDSAVQIALLNNQNLQATYEELGIAQAQLAEAGLLKNPTLSATVGIPKYAALPYQIDITQDFLDLLFMPIRKRIASAQFEATKLRVTQQVIETVSEVKAAFYRAQAAQQMLDLRKHVIEVVDASWDTAQRVHEAGNINDLTLANQQAEHEQAHIELTKQQRDALDAREELNSLMGLRSADIDWKISSRLPDVPATETDLHQAQSLAVSRRADLAASRQDLIASAQSLGLSKSTALLADTKIGIAIDQDVDGPFNVGPTLEIPLPIFNQGQPAIAAAVSRFRQTERRYMAQAIEICSQVRKARNHLLADRELAEYYRKVFIPLRQRITKQEQLQFNAMQVNLFELLMTKQAEIDAGRNYVQSLENYWLDRAELERVTGGALPTPAAPTTQEHR